MTAPARSRVPIRTDVSAQVRDIAEELELDLGGVGEEVRALLVDWRRWYRGRYQNRPGEADLHSTWTMFLNETGH